MKELQGRLREHDGEEVEFCFPVQKVAEALDVSAEELLKAATEHKIGYRKITDHEGSVIIQVEAYARHCTVTAETT